MDDQRSDQTRQGCIPALWNELGPAGTGCLLMMVPLFVGGLRLIAKVWEWGAPVEGAMVWWIVGVFFGGIALGHEGLKLAPNLRRIDMPAGGIAIALVLTGAAIVMWVTPTIGHTTATIVMLGLGALFGLFGASWLGL